MREVIASSMSEQSSTVHCVSDSSWQSTFQDLGRQLIDTTFVVIDLETTGGAPHLGAAITEIGAVKVKAGHVIQEFNSFVNPEHPVPSYITELTGINDAMLAGAPTAYEIFPHLMEFLGDHQSTVLVAQNAPFDLSFLKYAASINKFTWPNFPVLDTAIIARKVLTRDEAPNCRLGTLAEFFGTSTTPNHRALDDARATVDVFHGLLERLGSLDIYTLEELLNFGKRIKKPKSPELRRPNSVKE
jgi:DNA polymerase III epsilon subunit family exonuclease